MSFLRLNETAPCQVSASVIVRFGSLQLSHALILMIFQAVPCFLTSADAAAQEEELTNQQAIELFEREVRPLFLENCIGCHSQSVNKVKGGLSLDNHAALVAGGDSGPAIDLNSPQSSLLLQAVRRESLEMPPDRSLTSAQIKALERWLQAGAPWPEYPTQSEDWIASRAAEHWAWQPLQPALPPQLDSRRTDNPVDAFVLSRLRRDGIEPATEATDLQLLRRLYIDLIGIPPSADQLSAELDYLQQSPDWSSQLVERLLASPQFGVHWSRHWLDLMRYAETLGHEFDYPIHHAWRYRDAVINAFNDDLPYDRFVSDHLAGDLSESPRLNPLTGINESLALTGWWWLGDSVHAPVDIKSDWATRIENQIDVLSKSFLGMTVACARCHDHKFDAISMQDYYGLMGIAKSTRRIYAATDPHGKIAQHRQAVLQSMDCDEQVKNLWAEVSSEAITRWLEESLQQWRTRSLEEVVRELSFSSPLFPLRLLLDQPDEVEDAQIKFADRWSKLLAQAEMADQQFHQWHANSVALADFSHGVPTGWQLQAIESQDFHHGASIDWFDINLPTPARRELFRSDLLGRSQSLTLRSPNFPLTHQCICLKMRGKGTHSVVCVDGFFMGEFHNLLFADMRKPIDQPDPTGWVVHAGDIKKYLHEPAFLSLENQSGSWFHLAEVRLADSGPPPEVDSWALKLLRQAPTTRQELTDRMVQGLSQAIQRAASSDACDPESAAVAHELLRRFLPQLLDSTAIDKLSRLAQEVQQIDSRSPTATLILAAQEGDPVESPIELRGNPNQLGETVSRSCFRNLVATVPLDAQSSGRLELAATLVNPQHPLTARVIVNRVWQHLMGRGLVDSPDNLGVLGGRPTHVELLDYLARQFMQNDWSIKWLIRTIVFSKTYRTSSTALPEHQHLDPDGSLYSHRNLRRLSAESLRDSLLQAAGCLDLQLFGNSVPIHLSPQMTGRGRPSKSGPLDGDLRRSLFIEVRRNFLDPFQVAFDFPMPSSTTGKRNRSNVPAQALALLNDPLVIELCQRWVAQMAVVQSTDDRIDWMYRAAFSRLPNQSERQRCHRFIEQSGQSGWADLAHTLLNSKEFYYLK